MLLQHARPLPDGHADTRAVLGPAVKDALGLVQAAASKQQLGYALTVARPLLDLVEVAMVRDQRLVGSSSDQSVMLAAPSALARFAIIQRRPACHPGICPCTTDAGVAQKAIAAVLFGIISQ